MIVEIPLLRNGFVCGRMMHKLILLTDQKNRRNYYLKLFALSALLFLKRPMQRTYPLQQMHHAVYAQVKDRHG